MGYWLAVLALGCGGPAPRSGGAPPPPPSAAPVAPALPAPVPSAAAVVQPSPQLPAEPPRVAVGRHGAVASQEANATDVALGVLQQGGNAVDAAIALGLALAVTHPSAGNLGGGGFMVIRRADGAAYALDYRETAPSAASRDMYLDAQGNLSDARLNGPKAAGIPGTVAGFAAAHAKLGKLPWRALVEPALRLARDGFTLTAEDASTLGRGAAKMRELGYAASARIYSRKDGAPLQAGDRWVQPELAKTLGLIATEPTAFYRGPLAATLAREVRRAGGLWTPADLARYEARWREPVVFDYRGHTIITMPLPSAGGVVLEQLLVASEVLGLERRAWRSADEIHLFAEAMRRTYADRNQLLGDPDFVKVPPDLLETSYIRDRMRGIELERATPSAEIQAGVAPAREESTQTTHYSVVDADGNAVANTYTLNTGFGAKFVVPGTGVLLNNEMDDFAVKPGAPNVFGLVQGEPNKIEPGKRMLSSMTPTVVVRGGRLRAVLGSPGGPTISTTVAQLVRGLVDYGQPLSVVVPALRVHHQWLPDQIWTEEQLSPALKAELERRGHVIRQRPHLGHANVIEVDAETGERRAVADTTRGEGKAAAY